MTPLIPRRLRAFWGLGALPWLFLLAAAAAPDAAMELRDWARFSVLTPPGPEEPSPEVMRKVKRLLWVEHKVQKGEYSAWHLAKLYRTKAESIQATNNDELFLLYPGRKVVVHNQEGMLYEVKKDSETLDQIVGRYHHDPKSARQFKAWVVKANDLPGYALLEDYEFEKGSRVLLPGVKINFDTYHFPFAQAGWQRISSRFGMRRHPISRQRRAHVGVDIPKPYGTPVVPSRSGKVIEAGWAEGYGLLVVIRHNNGWSTRYGHLSKIHVKVGQVVQRGRTMIGRVGSTGNSTGPHLHFEVRTPDGRPLNPTTKIGRR